MSKVRITIDVDEYICRLLDYMRQMPKTGDYSQLPTYVERIQQHANAMEDGLYKGSDFKHSIKRVLKDEDMTNAAKLKELQKIVEKYE